MHSPRRILGPSGTLWVGIGLVLLATLVLAPVVTVTAYYDAADPGVSYQETKSLSLVGLEANVWLWLTAVVLIVVMTVRRYRRTVAARERGSARPDARASM